MGVHHRLKRCRNIVKHVVSNNKIQDELIYAWSCLLSIYYSTAPTLSKFGSGGLIWPHFCMSCRRLDLQAAKKASHGAYTYGRQTFSADPNLERNWLDLANLIVRDGWVLRGDENDKHRNMDLILERDANFMSSTSRVGWTFQFGGPDSVYPCVVLTSTINTEHTKSTLNGNFGFRLRVVFFGFHGIESPLKVNRIFSIHCTFSTFSSTHIIINMEFVKVDVQGTGVATVQLNRPRKRNAFNQSMINEIVRTLQELDTNDEVRAVVLTGGDSAHFCGMFDIPEIRPIFGYTRLLETHDLLASTDTVNSWYGFERAHQYIDQRSTPKGVFKRSNWWLCMVLQTNHRGRDWICCRYNIHDEITFLHFQDLISGDHEL